jgi:hypothetical protein
MEWGGRSLSARAEPPVGAAQAPVVVDPRAQSDGRRSPSSSAAILSSLPRSAPRSSPKVSTQTEEYHPQAHHLIGHRRSYGQVGVAAPTLPRIVDDQRDATPPAGIHPPTTTYHSPTVRAARHGVAWPFGFALTDPGRRLSRQPKAARAASPRVARALEQ